MCILTCLCSARELTFCGQFESDQLNVHRWLLSYSDQQGKLRGARGPVSQVSPQTETTEICRGFFGTGFRCSGRSQNSLSPIPDLRVISSKNKETKKKKQSPDYRLARGPRPGIYYATVTTLRFKKLTLYKCSKEWHGRRGNVAILSKNKRK